MMNKTILMLSVSCMSFIAGADLCYAGFNPDDTPPVLNAAMLKSHVSTHTSHLTAAHLSSLEDIAELTLPENSGRDREGFKPSLTLPNSLGREEKKQSDRIKLAAACFVTDTTNCSGNEFAGNNADEDNGGVPPGGQGDSDDYDLDNAERCRQEGYTQTSCPEGQKPANTCPYDSTYFEKCVSSCPSNYVTCEPPYYGVGEACDGKYASCEKDTERACQELNPGYVDECSTGQQLSDDRCSYDNTYGTCCNTCEGYDNTTIPEGYIQDGESCTGCDGQEHYKIKPNPCDGFMDCGSMGPEAGAKTCLSGSTTKYDNCKPCPNKGTLTSCPSPFTCTYEECSGLWYKTGCQPGYDWNANSQTCTQQCSPNYQYTCTGTGYAGGSGTACNGKYTSCTCASGYEWKNGACQKKPAEQAEWGKCNGYAKNCNIGDFIFSDRTCSSQKISGKTPIAVVVYKSDDSNCGQAMALKSIGSYIWGPTYDDILTLTNFDSTESISYDLSSCVNTQKIIAEGDKNTYPAAWAAHEYKTEGTEAGDWCLPAAGVWMSIENNISLINNRFVQAQGTQIGDTTYWSSSEYLTMGAWNWTSASLWLGGKNYRKDNLFMVRPVLEF